MEKHRYSPQYPLTFQVIELTKYDKVVRFTAFLAFFAYILSIGSRLNSYTRIISLSVFILFVIISAIIRSRKKHYTEKGKMVLYDNRVEFKTQTGTESVMLSENKVNANLREYSAEAAPMGTLGWLKGEVGNTITFTQNGKSTKYHFFLDNPSHAKMLVRRFEEWKAKGISCLWKTSSAI